MAYLIKTLSASISILVLLTLTGCAGNKKRWTDITTFFNKEELSKDEIGKKVSPEAINAIVRGDTTDMKMKVKAFFVDLSKYKDYHFDRTDSLLYVTFNKNDQIAGGPTIEIKASGEHWYITDVRFGK